MLSTKDKHGLLMIGGVALVFIAFIVYRITHPTMPPVAADNCVGEPAANTVLLLDHSEQISDQTKREIEARAVHHVLNSVKVNERVSIFTISELSKKSLIPLISLCRPPNTGNRLVESPQMIAKKFQQNFEKPIREALAIPPADSKESPIAQAVADVSLSQYLRGPHNSLLVFSDMLEHTSRFSLYKCRSGKEAIAQYRVSKTGAQERPHFENTEVKLSLIPRLNMSKDAVQCREQFWMWFFGDNSGAHAEFAFDYLPGGETPTAAPVAKGAK